MLMAVSYSPETLTDRLWWDLMPCLLLPEPSLPRCMPASWNLNSWWWLIRRLPTSLSWRLLILTSLPLPVRYVPICSSGVSLVCVVTRRLPWCFWCDRDWLRKFFTFMSPSLVINHENPGKFSTRYPKEVGRTRQLLLKKTFFFFRSNLRMNGPP